jgi:hypothetical protein
VLKVKKTAAVPAQEGQGSLWDVCPDLMFAVSVHLSIEMPGQYHELSLDHTLSNITNSSYVIFLPFQ